MNTTPLTVLSLPQAYNSLSPPNILRAMSAPYNDCTTFVSTYPTNLSAGTDASNLLFLSRYNNELAGLATPPRERRNAIISQFDPDALLFAFPFSQSEDSYVSPVSALLPSYDDDTEFQVQDDNDTAIVYPKVVPRKFLFPPVTPPATPQRQRNVKTGKSVRFEPYNVRDRSPEQQSSKTISSLPSPPTSPSPSGRSQTRTEKPTPSTAALQPNPLSVISAPPSSSSTPVSSSTTTGNENLEAEPCPRHCIQEAFPPEFVREVSEKYGIPPAQILHYRKRDGNFHYCPLDCGHYTVGSSMARHLAKHHPGIEGTTVQCTVKSLKGERCLRQLMQGAEFLAHFERDHHIQDALCPFCLEATVTPKMMDHFAVCSEIEQPAEVEERKPQPWATRGGLVPRTLRRKKLPLPRVQKAPSFVMKLRLKKRRPARYA